MVQDEGAIKSPATLSDAYLKMAKWSFEYKESLDKAERQSLINPQHALTPEDFDKSIGYCQKATEIVKKSTEAWHFYSQINYEACSFYQLKFAESLQESKDLSVAANEDSMKTKKAKIIIPEDYGEKIVKMINGQARLLPK